VNYKIKIDKDALLDIQEIINWYNSELQGLGLDSKTDCIANKCSQKESFYPRN